MNNNIFDSPMFLIKFGKREFLEQIINGTLRFTSLKRYQDFENHTIGDENEGMESIIHQDGNMKVSFMHPLINGGKETDCSNSIKSIKNFPDLSVSKYVSCFSFFTQNDILNKNIFDDAMLKESDWQDVLLFVKPDDFINTVFETLKDFHLHFNPVLYIDYSINQIGLNEFVKSKEYKYQREIRFSMNYNNEYNPNIHRIDSNILEINLCKLFQGIIVPAKDFRDGIKFN